MMKFRINMLLIAAFITACSQPGTDQLPVIPSQSDPSASLPAILPTPAAPGVFQPTACRFALPEDVEPGKDVDCGYLSVPERRDVPLADTRLIQLAVAIFHPPAGAEHTDPVIFLSGGPGASALEMVRYDFDLFSEMAFTNGRDLIVFDQRGIGVSRPALDCPDYVRLARDLLDREVAGRVLTDPQIAELLLDTIATCRDTLLQVADLSAYNSLESALDVRDLRLALGYERVNLWGGSYGTRLALEVMRQDPQGLRSVILDSVYPPDVDLYAEGPANLERALDKLFSSCAANPVCSQAYPDLESLFYETVQRLDENPIQAELIDPFTGAHYPAWMNGDILVGMTFRLLYNSRIRYLLPAYIDDASRNDFSAFNLMRGILIGRMDLSSLGMSLSVQCHEELSFSSQELVQSRLSGHPELAGIYENSLIGPFMFEVCQDWPAGKADPSANQPVYSDVPTLLMSGEFDPITPPAWGRKAAQTLSRAYYFEYPGIGHGASLIQGCPQDMAIAFLAQPETVPDDTCIAGLGEFKTRPGSD